MNLFDLGWPEELWHWQDALTVLGRHLELIEEQIEESQEKLDQEWRERVEEAGDKWDCIDGADYEYGQSIVARVLRNSSLVSFLSLYESITHSLAGHLQCDKPASLRRYIRESGLIYGTKRYYEEVLDFRLSTNHASLKRLDEIRKIRKFIVHKNGCFDNVEKDKREDERNKILNIHEGIEDQYGYVVLSKGFLSDMFRLVKNELEDLMERYTNWEISQGWS